MNWFMRILGFAGIVALGWASIFIVFALGPTFNSRLSDVDFARYKLVFTSCGPFALIVGTLLGLGNFFTEGRTRVTLLLMPLILPPLTCAGIMAYYFFAK